MCLDELVYMLRFFVLHGLKRWGEALEKCLVGWFLGGGSFVTTVNNTDKSGGI